MKKQMLILLALGLVMNSCAQDKPQVKIKDIDAFLNYNEKLNKFNGTVLIAQNGKVLLHKGYGYRDYSKKILNDTNSIYQIYSITKTFTSTMILNLIEQKKLSLNDRLNKFYPGFPNGVNITIEHLLTHTSGINDNLDGPGVQETEAYRVSQFGENKPNFAPGEGWSYCNGGYQLLGYIIAKITGVPYEKAIRENIFNPLQMTKSGFDFKALSDRGKVTAYRTFTNNQKQVAVLYDSTGPFSAGAIYSTTGDLYKYYKSFKSHQILDESSQKIAFSPSNTNKGYGHGWQLNDRFIKSTIIFHGGGAAGFRSNFAMIPEDDICIIILNNHENASPEYLTRKIIDILNNKDFELPKEMKLEKADLQKLVGAFSIKEPKMMVYTSILDNRLAIDVAGQGKTTVIARDKTTFIQDEADAILEFHANEKGIYSEFSIKQGSGLLIAKKIESSWGLIGDATTKGWVDSIPDVKLTEDKRKKGLWFINNVSLVKGEIKFRLNNDWNINYGDNQEDEILDMHGENIKVEAGVYKILLDMTNEEKPRYEISRIEPGGRLKQD